MSKGLMVVLAVVVIVLIVGITIGSMWIQYNNGEISLRNQITMKLKDNQSEFDNMWKKISQVTQVAVKDRESLSKIFNDYAEARTPKSDNAALMRWVQESIPNINQQTFTNIQNIVISSRDSWTMRQKELLDYKREHDNLRTLFPSSIFVGGRPEIIVTIITSSKTENAFKTGKDEDVDLFKK
jgi:uncharacterized membrane-anchored protein YhcB (DUF1043 family)